MDVERTIQFLLKNQARMDARMDAKFAKAERRMDRLERVVAQNNRITTRLVRYGVSLRSDVRRTEKALAETAEKLAKTAAKLAETDEKLAETDEKLNALIDIVDNSIRGNGQRPRR
jgi:septal ring factor EnvC (AmiA/AmiB activator)